MLTGDPARSSKIYLAIGVVSLAKALALRNDSTRFKRELLDAGLFIGAGLALRRYGKMKAEKQQQLREQLPSWIAGGDESSTRVPTSAIRAEAKRRLGSEPEPEPTLTDRALNAISGR